MNGLSRHTVLLTGATGFIGSHLAGRLVRGGSAVHLIVKAHSDLLPIRDIADTVTIHEHDGSTEQMHDIVSKVRPTLVFHLASCFLAQHRPADITGLIDSNVLFATQLVDAMTACGVGYLVNTGTSWQHFDNRPYSPVNLYAATKQAFEAILQYYAETTPLRAVTLELYDTYGPDDPRPKLFTLLRKVAREQASLAMSPGEQLIDLVYIDDVIEAFVLAGERLLEGKVSQLESFAVSSGAQVKLRDLVEIYSRVIGKELPIGWGERPYRDREVMVPWCGGKRLPGWEPRIGLEQGIAMMEGMGNF
jgi:nucleoside-diphosphate-sugar epimerase